MRRQLRFLIALVIVTLPLPIFAVDRCAAGDPPPAGGAFRDDRVLVKLELEAAALASALPEQGLPRGVPGLDDFLAGHGIREGHRLVRAHGVPIGDPELFRKTGLDRWYVLRLPEPGIDRVRDLLAELRRHPAVERAEEVSVQELLGIPNDPLFSLQWQHDNTGQTGGTADADMDSPEAWDLGTGNPSGVIGFLDTGVDREHEDLVGAITAGYDFANDDDDPEDDFNHGTSTAGLAAARTDNGIGVAGVCWGCVVMPLKISDLHVDFSLDLLIDAIRWGADGGADVIGNMGGGTHRSQAFLDAVNYALGRGTLMVGVNGNLSQAQAMPLATAPGVVAVGATDHNDDRVLSYGDHLALSAPGWNTYTTAVDDAYTTFSGTCPAVAIVSGIAGLLRAEDESLHVNELRHLLELGADDQVGRPEEDTPGWDRYMGWGRVNLHGSLSRIDGPWLALDRPHYLCAGEVTVALKDKTAGGSAEVTLTAGPGRDTETVTVLPRTDQGYYEATIPISWADRDGPAVAQDGKLDVGSGDTITATAGTMSASAFVDCVKAICLDPRAAPLVSGDCDADGAADPGELWSVGLVLHSDTTESLPAPVVVLESTDPEVEILNGTILQHELSYGGAGIAFPYAFPDFSLGGGPASLRVRAGAPVNHAFSLRVTSIHGTGWESDPVACAARFGEPTIVLHANRDLGPEQNRWDFDDGTAQGFTSAVAHGTGDLSECETALSWNNGWQEDPVSDRSHSGDYAMRLGRGGSYSTGIDAGLITPPFDVSAGGGAISFRSWADTWLNGLMAWMAYDGFVIEAKPAAESIWSYVPDDTYGFMQMYDFCHSYFTVPFGWEERARLFAGDGDGTAAAGDRFDRQHQISLDSFAGSTVQARFRFGSASAYFTNTEQPPPGEGVWIDTVTVHPWIADTWPGTAPANLEGSEAGCPASYDLTWDPVDGAGGYDVYRSEISCDDAGSKLDAYGQAQATAFSDTAIVEGTTYYYAVEALEAGSGCSSARACVSGGCGGAEYGGIAGTALLEGESDHSGVSISTLPASATAVTSADGGYVLSSVPAGTYSVLAAKDGWIEGRVDGVEVSAGETTPGIDFLLHPIVVNLPPEAEDQVVSAFMNKAVAITLVATDPEGDPLTYSCVDLPANGALAGCEDGDPYVTYTPNLKFTGTDTFTFKANDGMLDSDVATVTVIVKKRSD